MNVLVALSLAGHAHHAAVMRWMKSVERFATTAVTESGLTRILMNEAVTGRRTTSSTALQAVERLRSNDRAEFWNDDSSLAEPRVNLDGFVGHRQATDFHLLNLAAQRGGVLVTLDRTLHRAVRPEDRRHLRMISA